MKPYLYILNNNEYIGSVYYANGKDVIILKSSKIDLDSPILVFDGNMKQIDSGEIVDVLVSFLRK